VEEGKRRKVGGFPSFQPIPGPVFTNKGKAVQYLPGGVEKVIGDVVMSVHPSKREELKKELLRLQRENVGKTYRIGETFDSGPPIPANMSPQNGLIIVLHLIEITKAEKTEPGFRKLILLRRNPSLFPKD